MITLSIEDYNEIIENLEILVKNCNDNEMMESLNDIIEIFESLHKEEVISYKNEIDTIISLLKDIKNSLFRLENQNKGN